MEWMTTTTILHGLRDFSNAAAWERLVGRFRVPIAAFAREMGLDPTESEDLSQIVLAEFAKAYRQGRYQREHGRLSSWLFGIAYRQSLKVLRDRAHDPRAGVETRIITGTPAGAEASRVWDGQWQRTVLDLCLARARSEVEPETFEAFDLTARRGLDAEQAAAQLGVPVKSIYNAKHRVLKRIRELSAEIESME